jgi:predicted PurR-regulated permease PerM
MSRKLRKCLALASQLVLTVALFFFPLLLQQMEGNRGTQLYSNPAYWGVMVLTIFCTFSVIFLMSEVGERDEFDDLNRKIDEHNERLTNGLNTLTTSIHNLTNEIRDDLSKKIEEHSEQLTNRFSALMASIDNLANEIRKGRVGR